MLTWVDLKAEVPEEVWENITQGDDSLGDRCINKARAWLSARLRPCAVTSTSWDESDVIIRQILLYRALYELFSYVDRESAAIDRREAAEEMLRGAFGPCIDAANAESPEALPLFAFAAGRIDWEGFR